jgi:hypothetical protein
MPAASLRGNEKVGEMAVSVQSHVLAGINRLQCPSNLGYEVSIWWSPTPRRSREQLVLTESTRGLATTVIEAGIARAERPHNIQLGLMFHNDYVRSCRIFRDYVLMTYIGISNCLYRMFNCNSGKSGPICGPRR